MDALVAAETPCPWGTHPVCTGVLRPSVVMSRVTICASVRGPVLDWRDATISRGRRGARCVARARRSAIATGSSSAPTSRRCARAGYIAVGRDFPVFLDPETHEEHALARTERKTAPGYHGFEFHADPGVTLEQDLAPSRPHDQRHRAGRERRARRSARRPARPRARRCCATSRRRSPKTPCASFASLASRRASPTSASPTRPAR